MGIKLRQVKRRNGLHTKKAKPKPQPPVSEPKIEPKPATREKGGK